MNLLDAFLLDRFLAFTLVLVRVGGLMLLTPVVGAREIPAQARVLLALALALLIAPSQAATHVSPPHTLIDYGLMIAGEALVGLTLGLGVAILFSGVHLAGQIIGQMSGTSLADVFNPGFDVSVPVFSQLLHVFATALFLLIGGHRLVVGGLLRTFAVIPLGQCGVSGTVAESLTALVAQSFQLGIRAAAPTMVALLVATVVLGLISRTMPQLNVFALGFGLNSLVMCAGLLLSLGGIAWVFEAELEEALTTLVDLVVPSGGSDSLF